MKNLNKEILSPMATGNGAFVAHKDLERSIGNYSVLPYSPWLTLMPPLLYALPIPKNIRLIHTTPDYGLFFHRLNKPLILTFHNYMLDKEMMEYSSLLQKAHYSTDLRMFISKTVQLASAITAVSKFTAECVKNDLGIKKEIPVIYNGIDVSTFYPDFKRPYNKKFRILFSGNMTKRKGADLLPKIADKLSDNIEIVCATGLRKSRQRYNNHSNIIFINNVPYLDMPSLYRQMDALLMPTIREGLSISVLEAMASGLPIVTSDCSSMPEQIIHGKGGLLCKTRSVESYVNAINQLAQDKQLTIDMGLFNRNRVEKKFTATKMAHGYKRLFESIF